MLNGDGNENGKKIKRSNKPPPPKKKTSFHFLYISLPLLLQRETSK